MEMKEKMEPWQCEGRLGKTWRPRGRRRRKANTQKMRKEGSQAQEAITESPVPSQRGEGTQAGTRLAPGWQCHYNNQERTKSQAGTLPRQKAAEQEFGV